MLAAGPTPAGIRGCGTMLGLVLSWRSLWRNYAFFLDTLGFS